MEWERTGVARIDGEHERLVASLGALMAIVGQSHDPAVTRKMLSIIVFDMVEHCKREDAIAVEMLVSDQEMATLRDRHAALMDEYRRVVDAVAGSTGDEAALVEQLIGLTLRHIAEVDVPLFRRVRGR